MINITNVITISVSTPPAGLAPYSVNNLACFTKDTPVNVGITSYAVYTNPTDVLADWGSASKVYEAAVAVFSQSPNILTGGGKFIVFINGPSEDLATAIARVKDIIYFGGCSYTFSAGSSEVIDAAEYCQSVMKLLFIVSSTESDLDSGLLFDLQDQTLTKGRGLYYSASAGANEMKWAYAGRGMSTNFNGSNTSQTMHLKQLPGVSSDDISQTVLEKCKDVGADVYVAIAGRPSVMSYGKNSFFDDEYNLSWFVGALEVAGFNFLAQTSTKIPQTEDGMNGLKGAYRDVCRRAVSNRFVAPGTWNSPDTFGSPEDFKRNIADFGFYVYSAPVALQSQADRESRIAPLVQVAVKYSGSIHSSDLIININK
jgi:hypothetical protein